MDVSLTGGQEARFNGQMRTEDMEMTAVRMDSAGLYAVEIADGFSFDRMAGSLNENPWDRIRTLKKYLIKTPCAMRLSALHLAGRNSCPADLIRAFISLASDSGIDIFRIYDPLNDIRNFGIPAKAVKAHGKHLQACICMPESGIGKSAVLKLIPDKAKALESQEADSICIMTETGALSPFLIHDLISALKSETGLPVQLSIKNNGGITPMSLIKAVDAGVDILDTAISPLAVRGAYPAIEHVILALQGTDRDTGLDIEEITAVSRRFETKTAPEYATRNSESSFTAFQHAVICHEIPETVLLHVKKQLNDVDAEERFDEVLLELEKVKADLGAVHMVFPLDEMVATQAVNNVLFDEKNRRYKMVTSSVKAHCFGLNGITPRPVDHDVQVRALKDFHMGDTPVTSCPSDVLKPALDNASLNDGNMAEMADAVIHALFPEYTDKNLTAHPETAATFAGKKLTVNRHEAKTAGENPPPKSKQARRFNVFVGDEFFDITVDEVGGPSPVQQTAPPPADRQPPAPVAAPQPEPLKPRKETEEIKKPAEAVTPPADSNGEETPVRAPMPGTVVKYEKQPGDTVTAGETVVIIEAMKMENSLPAPVDGIMGKTAFSSGDSVSKNDILCMIG